MLARIYFGIQFVSKKMILLNGAVLVMVACLVAGDVIFRKLFSITLAGSDEISGYVLAIASAWAYSACLLHRSHIRIDVVYSLFPSWIRCWFDVVGLLALLTFNGVLSYRALGVLTETLERGSVSNTPLQTPLWLPQSLWVAGLMFFTLTLIVVLTRTILAIIQGDRGLASSIAGIPTIQEEIKSETQSLT